MPSQETIYSIKDRVATITLNRPDRLNAWTAVMEQEVRAAIGEAERDEQVRVIVLTGAGRGFCAGADMSLLSSIAGNGVDARAREEALRSAGGTRDGVRADFQKKYSYFPAVTKPVIAGINGPVVGLGLVIALYCDLRCASGGARLGTAFAQRGLIAELRYGMDAAATGGTRQRAGSVVYRKNDRRHGSAENGPGEPDLSARIVFGKRAEIRD